MIVSNDSDLAFAVAGARALVPVGVVNPSGDRPAGALRASEAGGVPGQWRYQLTRDDLTGAQMPDRVRGLYKPPGW